MRNKSLYRILFILLGLGFGYFIGIEDNLSGWDLIREIMYGIVVFYSLGDAFLEDKDKYGILIGTIVGLLVSVSTDLIAGSPVVVKDKLVFMMIGSFIGWGAGWGKPYWIPVLIGGLIGGVIGFITGFKTSYWFGQVNLVPGLLNAELTSIHFFMVGMGVTSLFLKSFGWRLIANHMHVD